MTYFTSVLCVFVAVLVFVQCQHVRHPMKYLDYTPAAKIECQDHRGALRGVMQNSTCKPHYKHVPLKPMHTQEFHPSVVRVRRCDGHCPGLTCMPVRSGMIKLPVKARRRGPGGATDDKCAIVEVEEHTQCKCMCRQKKGDCNERQYYSEKQCACICKNGEMEREICEAKMGMLWDDATCSCNCTEMNMECTTGLKWHRDQCRCE